ncbi:MAG: hypothetical protein LBS84_01695 [Clostridiales bacterium]|jgi:DNA repair exonuclease SbcCD ATPase subunit|nr:hypothetical protein [Clostridiales bacterium]
MPKLNRIRISNVSYDNKYILDQLYDLYGGEHTLFNLANGSGKSVLVQMIMQPVLPCQRIHERKIESYLSKNSSPTYIMLEWILDNTLIPVYFLTGIVMCSVGQGDETGSRVKYFTFTYKYESASDYDIAHTPLIQREADGYRYMPYEEASRTLKSVRDELRPMRCYLRDNSDKYQRELREHGIFAKEWQLLSRVNNKEGGVDELFSDCKSSDALLNKWILKTIADNTDPEEKNLSEMFQALFSAILEQESTIKEKETLTDFLLKADQLKEDLRKLRGGLGELENTERLLCGLHAYFLLRVDQIDAEKQECARAEEERRTEKQRIRYEELSEEWHTANESFLNCEDDYGKRRTESEIQNDRLIAAKRERDIMAAAEHMADKRGAEAELLALKEQLERIKTGETVRKADDILFSLNKAYADEITRNKERIGALAKRTADLEEMLSEAGKNKSQAENEIKQLSEELGSLNKSIDVFLEYETNCLERLNITIRRNLSKRLDDGDIATASAALGKRVSERTRESAELKLRLDAEIKRKENLDSETAMLRDQLTGVKVELSQKQAEFDEYNKIIRKLREIASRQKVSGQAGDAADSLNALRQQSTQRKTELSQWEALLAVRSETLTRFKMNSLHNAPEFVTLLKNGNIPFITGEDYLKERDGAEQERLLRLNPMLPFSFLVGRADFTRAAALRTDDGIDRICPVFVLENAGADLAAGDQSAALTEFGQAMCFYYENSFRPDTKDAFGRALENDVERIKNSRDMWRTELESLQRDIDFLEAFPYGADSGPGIEQALIAMNTEQNRLIEQIETNRRESAESASLADALRVDMETSVNETLLAKRNMALFEEYLTENEKYIRIVEQLERSGARRKALQRQISEIVADETGWNSEIRANGAERATLTLRRNITAGKQAELNPPKNGKLLDWPVSRLEETYGEIKYQQTENERVIQIQLSECNRIKTNADKKLSRYRHIPAETIEAAEFDETRLEWLSENEKQMEQILQEKRSEESKAKSMYDRAEVNLDNCRKRLREEGWTEPLRTEIIKRDYKNRLAVIHLKLSEISENLAALNREHVKCQADINRILRIVDDPSGDRAPEPENGWGSVDIDASSARLKQLRSANDALRHSAMEAARELEFGFTGKHAGIDCLLSSLHVGRDDSYAEYTITLERLTLQCEQLEKNVQVLNSFLERLEDQQSNVVYHAHAHGKRLHAEIKKITELSRIKLSPDRTKQQTLRIGVPEEPDAEAVERIRNHVDTCIAELRQKQNKNELTDKMLRQMIDTQMSDREILNQIIGQSSIDISLLKVDAIQANSRLRTWESVIKDNSGGELFVSCFILLSALMEYARLNMPIAAGAKKSGAKVMLIDNPFGRTSSEHLLDALIQAAGQFGMQMICLSDLSQSSITGKFSLIYQLALRPALYSNKQYLKTNDVIRGTLTQKNNLDYVSMKHEQISLF